MRRRSERHGNGNALVAILLGLLTGTVLVGLMAWGEGDRSEALAWGIASLTLLGWLGRAEG